MKPSLFLLWCLCICFTAGESTWADDLAAIQSVRFEYEGESQLTGSPVFSGTKTDYYWGSLEKHESVARHFRYDFSPSDPENRSLYSVSVAEWFVLDADTVITCQKSVEVNVQDAPQSLADAREQFDQYFERAKKHVMRYFKDSVLPANDELLGGFSFLGMTPDGPIWNLSEPTPDPVDGNPLFVYKARNGIEYRLLMDTKRSIFSKCSVSLQSTQDTGSTETSQPAPFKYESEISDSEDGFLLTSTSVQDPDSRKPQIVRVTERIFNFELNRSTPITMTLPPERGEKIDSVQYPQIKFEWRDGQIVKSVNQFFANDMEGVEFSRSKVRNWLLYANFAILAGVAAVMFWKSKFRIKAILIPAVLLWESGAAYASDVYCGVYAIYGAAKSLGADVELEKLIDPQFVSSQKGSSGEDLVAAARLLGLEATTLAGLGIASLKAAEQPLILHTAPLGTHGIYQHWILFLGLDDAGRARIVDGAGGVVSCTTEDVLSRWDGNAVAIRTPNSGGTHYLSTEFASLCLLISVGGVFSFIVRSRLLTFSVTARSWRSETLIHAVALFAFASAAGFILLDGARFRDAATGINLALGLRDLPKVNVEQLPDRIAHGAVLVDCRYEQDYKHGHIDGAISLPVDIGLGDFARTLVGVDRDADVVVYCQSAKCKFSNYSAVMLLGAGFKNVTLFEGGFESWEQYVRQNEAQNDG